MENTSLIFFLGGQLLYERVEYGDDHNYGSKVTAELPSNVDGRADRPER